MASPPAAATARPQHPPVTPLDDLVSWLQQATGVVPELRGPDGGTPAATGATGATGVTGGTGTEVTGITLSSQRVQPGDVYAALPGARRHGIEFLADATRAGAVAVLTDPGGLAALPERAELPVVVVPDPRAVLGRLASRVYGDPAAALRMIGVTGTQGKTTTTRLAEGGLEGAGLRAAVIGTNGTRMAGQDVPTALTTPEAPDLHGLFATMREQKVVACAMEVSSHALVLGRVDGVVFDVAVFLNLGRDHLDFHRDVEDYFRAKASLFDPSRARRGLVNLDDEHGRRLLGEVSIPVRTFSTTGRDADWQVADVVAGARGSTFTITGPDGLRIEAGVPLPGDFNVANALAAVAACGEAGLDPVAVARAVARGGGVPGRLERVEAGQDFVVVVDYAHKPDAVAAAVATLRPLTDGRVIVVLGAGGDRDPGKRPLMGRIAAELADVLVVTDDNPRSEDPAEIRTAVLAGAEGQRAEVVEVAGRREAIAAALDLAAPGDIVLVAGKGHETGQEVAGVVHPFDDRSVVAELLGERLAGTG